MSDYWTIRIDDARFCTRTVTPDRSWMTFGVEQHDPFVLNDPATDSLRVVEQVDEDRFIICNQWRTAMMPAPAFYYYNVRMTMDPETLPLVHNEETFHANYSVGSRTIVVEGQCFRFEGISQAISQGISGPEKSTPGLPSPLPAGNEAQPVTLVPFDTWRCSQCGTVNQKGQVVCSNYDLHEHAHASVATEGGCQ